MIKSNTTKQEIVKKLEASGEENQAGKKLFLLGDNENYKAVLESSYDVILFIDKMGNIVDANETLTRIGGYDREELVGENIRALAKIITPKSMEDVLTNFQRRLTGVHVPPYEVEMFKKSGGLLSFEINAQPFRSEGKIIGDLVVLHDITEYKLAERALKASQQNFRNSLDNSPMGVYIVDEDQNTLYANQAMLDIFGYANIDEVCRTPPHEHYTSEERTRFLQRRERQLRGESNPENFEIEITRKDGSIRHLQILRRYILWNEKMQRQIIYNDITERRKAEEALKVSEQNFRNSMDNSTMGIRIINAEGQILYWNQAFLDIFGYENIDEIRTIPQQERFTVEGYANYLYQKERALHGEPIPDKVETDIVRKDGTIRHLEVFRKKVLWDGKTQFQTLYNDITERKLLESNNAYLATFPEMGTDPILELDQEGNLTYLNPACKRTFPDLIKSGLNHPLRANWKQLVREFHTDNLVQTFIREVSIGNLIYEQSCFAVNQNRIRIYCRDITGRKQVELALQASEQNFRNSLDSSSIGIRISDKDDQTSYANKAMLDIFGYLNADKVRKSPPWKHYTPESYASYVQRHEKFLRGEPMPDHVEIDIERKDHTIKHLDVSMKGVFWDGKQQYQTLYNDITERVNATEALRQREADLKAYIDNSPDGIFIVNQFGMYTDVNITASKFLGYSKKELIGMSLLQITPSEDLEEIKNEFMKLQETGEMDQDISLIRKDGSTISVNIKGARLPQNRYIGYCRDITERKQTEKRLQEASREWRTTFDSINDLISIHDKNNRIVRVNRAFADMLKTTPKELIGKFCHEVMHGTQEPPVNCPHWQTLINGKAIAMESFNANLGIHFQESSSPLFNENGEVTGSVTVARDVTQQKRIEEQLIMTDRLASIGELSSGIAHELNNPLTSVIGFSQLLMEGDVPENIREDLGIVYSEAQRASGIVKNLLTFARKHAPVKQLSQVNSVIEEVLRLRAYEQKVNNIEIESHLATNLPEIMIDHFQMQQVFLNIIVNAEFAMLEAHHKGKLVITTERSDGVIKITFTDDGPGIDKENLKHIFDPFFTTKEVGKGTGLGLSICHGIVAEHSGRIFATSEKGQGATFVVELPLNSQ